MPPAEFGCWFVVQVDLHEEGHNASRDRRLIDFTEACFAISFVKSAAGVTRLLKFQDQPTRPARQEDGARSRRRMKKAAQKNASRDGAERGKISSQGGEKVAQLTAIRR